MASSQQLSGCLVADVLQLLRQGDGIVDKALLQPPSYKNAEFLW